MVKKPIEKAGCLTGKLFGWRKEKLFWYINPELDKEEIVCLPAEFVSAKDWEFIE